MKKLSLNGEYRLSSADCRFLCRADIPGSDIGNLIKYAGLENPLNAADTDGICRDIARTDFTFEGSFTVGCELTEYKNAVLTCEKLDTLCTVFINGKEAARSNNAHIPLCADVKPLLKSGENRIKLAFSSPLGFVERRQRERRLPPNVNGVNGAQYLRKANCHFGWDWGPCVPYNYCGDIGIEFFDREIEDFTVCQSTTAERAVIKVTAENADRCFLTLPGGETVEAGEDFTFTVLQPELWFTRDISEKETQPLYTVTVENEEMSLSKRIGLRSIELDRSADEWGENFCFVLNGKRVFAKGANVIPFAAIPEYADEKSVDYYLDLAARSNFNILRVWGGGEYASEHFLDRCDELGILVWQDFCFACMMYPLDEPDFLENVKAEAVHNIKRMAHRACLALWCGNNEIEECNPVFPKSSSLGKAYINYFYSVLPGIVSGLSDVPFIPTSPVGRAPFSGNSDENMGDCHMWSVWHGLMPLDYYGTRFARFLSEFGMESLPSNKAVKKFAPDDKSLGGPSFGSHQKCAGGNRKLMFYLCEKFSPDVELDLLPYLTGIVQAECIKAATEHFRRNRGRCSGSVFWQFNDVWNAPSWSAVDFEKVPKALMYKAREFFAPVTLTYSGGELFIHNDTAADKAFTAGFRVFSGKRLCRVFEKRVFSRAGSVGRLAVIPLGKGEVLRVSLDGREFTFDNVDDLPHAALRTECSGEEVTVFSDVYARNVCIECEGTAEENYFSLLPGESRTVRVNGGTGGLRVLCENNIDSKRHGIKRILFRVLYMMRPENAVKRLWFSLR